MKMLRLAALLALLPLASNAAQVRVLCQGQLPAEAYYYDGKESHPLKLADGQFAGPIDYPASRFALFATPPSFDSTGKLQTSPIAYADLPEGAKSALVLLVGTKADGGRQGCTMIAVPSAARGAPPALSVFNLSPVQLGVALDKETLQLPALSAQTLTLPASDSRQSVLDYQFRVAGQTNGEWQPLVMSKLRLRPDRQGYLVLTQPAAATGVNASSSEPLAWKLFYAPGS